MKLSHLFLFCNRFERVLHYRPILKRTASSSSNKSEPLNPASSGNKSDQTDDIRKFPLNNSSRSLITASSRILDDNVTAKTHSNWPSVSRILNETMPPKDKQTLERWKKSMVEKMGEEGFKNHQQMVLDRGKSLHTSVEEALRGTPHNEIQVDPANVGHWKSLEDVLPKISDAVVLENWVAHPVLNYRGIVDCVAKYRDTIVAVDWKSSERTKSKIEYTYDNPLQVVAYMGALNYDQHYEFQVTSGLIVIAYQSGVRAQLFFMDEKMVLRYWKKWLARVQEYQKLASTSH